MILYAKQNVLGLIVKCSKVYLKIFYYLCNFLFKRDSIWHFGAIKSFYRRFIEFVLVYKTKEGGKYDYR